MASAADPDTFASIDPRRNGGGFLRAISTPGARIAGVALVTLVAAGLAVMAVDGAGHVATAGLVLAVLASVAIFGFTRSSAPKVEIDTLCHEVRLVRRQGRTRFVLDRCSFGDLTQVEDFGTHLQLWGPDNTLIAEVPASDQILHRSVVTALRVAGKL